MKSLDTIISEPTYQNSIKVSIVFVLCVDLKLWVLIIPETSWYLCRLFVYYISIQIIIFGLLLLSKAPLFTKIADKHLYHVSMCYLLHRIIDSFPPIVSEKHSSLVCGQVPIQQILISFKAILERIHQKICSLLIISKTKFSKDDQED